jgi:formate/nitrite transporter FocA (FNT family)
MLMQVIALSVLPKDNATKSKLDRMQSQLADSAESSKATAASPALLDAYLCAVAGFSLGMGIVYAGTARDSVKACLLSKLKMLQRLVYPF